MAQATDAMKIVMGMSGKGFTKVTVINKSFQVVGASAQDAIPKAWKDEKTGATINENQELKDDWTKKEGSLHFYGFKWNIVGMDNSSTKIHLNRAPIDAAGTNSLIIRDINDHWVVLGCKLPAPTAPDKKAYTLKGWGKAGKAADDVFESVDWDTDD